MAQFDMMKQQIQQQMQQAIQNQINDFQNQFDEIIKTLDKKSKQDEVFNDKYANFEKMVKQQITSSQDFPSASDLDSETSNKLV